MGHAGGEVGYDGEVSYTSKSLARASRSIHMEQLLLRYQSPFIPKIKGMEPLEKFNLPKFTMYDEKSNSKLHIGYYRKMMALWSHLDTLICSVFPSILRDLGLRWFEKITFGSIGDFTQLFESFVIRFVVNTKTPKGVSSLLTLKNGKNETLSNSNKRYWELYKEIDGYSKD